MRSGAVHHPPGNAHRWAGETAGQCLGVGGDLEIRDNDSSYNLGLTTVFSQYHTSRCLSFPFCWMQLYPPLLPCEGDKDSSELDIRAREIAERKLLCQQFKMVVLHLCLSGVLCHQEEVPD